jgi:hypothetical protein
MDVKIMGISINLRTAFAPSVQEILTKYGCLIKTRLGLHETNESLCSEQGIVILQLVGDDNNIEALRNELKAIEGVKVNIMTI